MRDRVGEPETGEARRGGGEEDVPDERDRRCDHERRPDQREPIGVRAMDPRERDRGPREVQRDVQEPEQRGDVRDRLGRLLDAALDVDAERLLDRDDVVGVPHRCLDVLGAARHG